MRTLRWIVIAALAVGALFLLRRFEGGPHVEAGSTLLFEISGAYVEAPETPSIGALLGFERQSVVGVLGELRKVERDDRITQVILTVRNLQVGWGKAQELRDAIRALRDKGRHPVALLEVEGFGANLEYYVASAAEKLYVAPGSGAPILGLAEEHLFYGGLWDKLGVTMQVAQAGRYKGAADSLVSKDMGEYYREQAERLLDSIDGQFIAGIAEARGISVEAVRKVIATAPAQPEVLEQLGLIDGVATRRKLQNDVPEEKRVTADAYRAVTAEQLGFSPKATFALIYGSGAIQSGEGTTSRTGQPVFASETVIDAIEQAAKADDVRAIVLRIDSPGGSAFPSEQMWNAIRDARKKKPVVASFSDYAASGGYYVASAADAIVSQPGTLTGSIGVFAVRPSLHALLDRFDVHSAVLSRGANAEMNLMTPELSPDTRDWLQADVEDTYHRFVSRVSEGRGRPIADVEAIAEGRVWTGEQAVTRGLVDAIGGLRAAVSRAKEKAGIGADEDVSLAVYPPPKPLAEQIQQVLRSAVARSVEEGLPWRGALARTGAWLEAVTTSTGPVLAMPVWVDIR
jgi:protease IV